MDKITTVEELKRAIQQLEVKQAEEWPLLKGQVLSTYERLKPVNMIKSSMEEISSSSELKADLLVASLGLTVGVLSKTLAGRTHNPIVSAIINLLQVGITALVTKNPEAIKSVAMKIVNLFSKKGDGHEHKETEENGSVDGDA